MKVVQTSLLITTIIFSSSITHAQFINPDEPFAHTFSILAFDPETKEIGVAVQSHWFAVGNTVTWGEAGVGVVVTQAVANIGFGPKGLELLKLGFTPQQVIDSLIKKDPGREMRQLAVMDKNGNSASFTGKYCLPNAGSLKGDFFSVQGNTAFSENIWNKMAETYSKTIGSIGDKMIAALKAGQLEGGDIRGKQSSSMLIFSPVATNRIWIDRKVDLRVADHSDPIAELERLYQVQKAYDTLNYANSLYAKGLNDEAHYYYQVAQNLYPENRELSFWYTVELLNKNNLEKAFEILKVTFQQDSMWRDIIIPRLYKIGMLTISKEVYEKLLALNK